MTESTGRTRATAVITVHKYEPSAYDEPAELTGDPLDAGKAG